MPNRLASLLIASAVALTASAALAQTKPSPPKPAPAAQPGAASTVAPLTVQVAPTPKMIEWQSWDFVQTFSGVPNPELDQIARWRDPVCVAVMGLADEQAAKIKARIEDVAGQVGLRKAIATCRPNIEIVFTDKPQALVDGVYKQRQLLLGYYHRPDGKRLKTVTRPIQAWYLSVNRSVWSGWEQIADQDGYGCERVRCGMGTAAGSGNRFRSGIESLFLNVLVVADKKAVEGKDVGLLSDYLVMLTLAQPRRLDGCNSMPSVIDTLSPASCPHDAPDGMTAGDAAYLTALYRADLELRKNFEENDISDRMAAILIKASTGK